jgi:hypothetical protein
MNGPVREFSGIFAIGAVERGETCGFEVEPCGGIPQIQGKPFSQGRLVLARDWELAGGIIPAKPATEEVAKTEQQAGRDGRPVGRIERGHHLKELVEIVGAALDR